MKQNKNTNNEKMHRVLYLLMLNFLEQQTNKIYSKLGRNEFGLNTIYTKKKKKKKNYSFCNNSCFI